MKTSYPVSGLPPSEVGGCQVRSTWRLPALALSPLGAPGGPNVVTPSVADPGPGPAASVPTTWK